MSCIKKNYTIQVKANCCLRVIDGASVVFQMAQRACGPETANEQAKRVSAFQPCHVNYCTQSNVFMKLCKFTSAAVVLQTWRDVSTDAGMEEDTRLTCILLLVL